VETDLHGQILERLEVEKAKGEHVRGQNLHGSLHGGPQSSQKGRRRRRRRRRKKERKKEEEEEEENDINT
jgi:hypothetical protein